ncbi:MAG: TIGR02266 family protein [Thermoanaerobaculia bacterium]
MTGAAAQPIPFESRRVPLERRITLKFQHRDGFVNEYAANVSLKGMFITAWVPEPCGSVFLFEVQVADRQRLIHGVGEVVWVREAEESPERPSGMGVRFLKLDEASREVINGMVDSHVRRGGTPFDPAIRPEGTVGVEQLFGEETEPAPAAKDEEVEGQQVAKVVRDPRLSPFQGRAMARRGGRGLWLLWTTLIVLLGGSALLVLLT